jgi:hypothetical protein
MTEILLKAALNIITPGANPSFILLSSFNFTIWRGRGGLDRMLVEFTTTHAISAYPTDIEGSNPAQAKYTTLSCLPMVDGSFRVLRLPPPLKLVATI